MKIYKFYSNNLEKNFNEIIKYKFTNKIKLVFSKYVRMCVCVCVCVCVRERERKRERERERERERFAFHHQFSGSLILILIFLSNVTIISDI